MGGEGTSTQRDGQEEGLLAVTATASVARGLPSESDEKDYAHLRRHRRGRVRVDAVGEMSLGVGKGRDASGAACAVCAAATGRKGGR